MNNIESPADIERARNVFERAITVVGLHVTEVKRFFLLTEVMMSLVSTLIFTYTKHEQSNTED